MSEFDPGEVSRFREIDETPDPAVEGAFAAIGKYSTETDPRTFFDTVPKAEMEKALRDGDVWTENYGWVPASVVYDNLDRGDSPAPLPGPEPSRSQAKDSEPAPPADDTPPLDPPDDTPREAIAQPPEPDYEQILSQEPTCLMHYDGQTWQTGPDPNAQDFVGSTGEGEAIVAPGKITVARHNTEDEIMSPMLFTVTDQNPVVTIVNDQTGISAMINVDPATQNVHEQIIKTITDFPSLVARTPETGHEVRLLLVDDYEPSAGLIQELDSREIKWDHEYERFPLNVAVDSGTGIIVGSSANRDEFIYEPAPPNEVVLSAELEEAIESIAQNDPVAYCDLEDGGEWHPLDAVPRLKAPLDSIVLSRDPQSKIMAEFNNENTLIGVFNKATDADGETPYSAIINLSDVDSAPAAINNLCMNTPQIVTENTKVWVVGQPATDEIVSSFYDFGILNIKTPSADYINLEFTTGSKIEIEPGVDIKALNSAGEIGYSQHTVDELFPPVSAAAQIAETGFTESIREILNANLSEYFDINDGEVSMPYRVDVAVIEHTEESEDSPAVSVIGLRLLSTAIGDEEAYYAEAIVEADKMAVLNLPLNLTNPDQSLNIPATLIKILAFIAGQSGCNEIIVRTLENNITFIQAITDPLYDWYLDLESGVDRLEQLHSIFHSIYIQSAADLGFTLDSESGDMRRWTPRDI